MVRIPLWKRWLSHLWEQQLELTSSNFNPRLLVSVVQGRVQLTAQDAIYSFGDYYLNFRKAFHAFDFSRLPAQSEVLVMGLGLGSIPELLESVYQRNYDYVAVEIDPVIIQLAQAYSLPRLRSPIEVVNTEAELFLDVDQRRFDLICMDVFQDADIPEHLGTIDFLEKLREHLRPDGALIYNRLANNRARRQASQLFFNDFFRPVFPAATIVDTGGNYMLVSHHKFVD